MPLPILEPDHLTIFLFGPGFGELILARVSPDVWLVVDGCAAGDGYAQRVLDNYHARPRLIVLTHPHDDHSKGLLDVVVRATPRDRKQAWPRHATISSNRRASADKALYSASVFISRFVLGSVEGSKYPPCERGGGNGEGLLARLVASTGIGSCRTSETYSSHVGG